MPQRSPSRLLSRRPKAPFGWGGLAMSLGLHGSLVAAALWFSSPGAGSGEGLGAAQRDESAAPTLRVPMAVSPSAQVKVRLAKPARTFQPSNFDRVVVKHADAAVVLPAWEAQPVRPIEPRAMPPAPPAPPAAEKVVASVSKPRAKATAGKGSAQRSTRASGGSGGTAGSGSGKGGGESPRIVYSYPAEYPPAAKKSGLQGSAIVRVVLTAAGKVRDCFIARSTGSRELDRTALTTVRGWRFTATREGTEVRVTVAFTIS